MAAKRVKQSEVTWVPKDKKTGKGGYLALRSDKSKPFSGVVTGVKKGTTAASATGEAVYRAGRNVRKVAARDAAKRASAAAPSVTQRATRNTKMTPAAAPRAYEERKARPAPKTAKPTAIYAPERMVRGAVEAVTKKLTTPNKGSTKTETVNGKRVKYKWNGTRWIKQL